MEYTQNVDAAIDEDGVVVFIDEAEIVVPWASLKKFMVEMAIGNTHPDDLAATHRTVKALCQFAEEVTIEVTDAIGEKVR